MPKDINKKVADHDNTVGNFFKTGYLKYIFANLNCINLGRIIQYNKNNHTCSVQLLPLQSDGNKRTPLNEVIVPKSIWETDKAFTELYKELEDFNSQKQGPLTEIKKVHKSLKVGSVVAVGFFDREIDNFNGKSNYKLESERMHSLNDAIILEVIE